MIVRAWAPGRVNLIGEHVDYNEGIVLPIAISLGCRAWVAPREDGQLAMRSAQRPGEDVCIAIADIIPGGVEGWSAYVAGTAWALGALPAGGLDIAIDADVPTGAGLSSSAAVECAVAIALDGLLGLGLAPRDLAAAAQRAENVFVGVPTGAMDQTTSMLATDGHALRFDVRSGEITHVPYALAGTSLLVIDTRSRHALVDGGYSARRASCESATALLGRQSLRDATQHDLDRLARISPGLVPRARHVVTEISRVEEAAQLLSLGRAVEFGALMTASHGSLRDDFAVSCPELDTAVEAALSAGALGARMTGGGFGGSAIALVPDGLEASVSASVSAAFADARFAAPRVIPVRASAGARLL